MNWLHKETCTSISCTSSLENKTQQVCCTLFHFPPILMPFLLSPFVTLFTQQEFSRGVAGGGGCSSQLVHFQE